MSHSLSQVTFEPITFQGREKDTLIVAVDTSLLSCQLKMVTSLETVMIIREEPL